LLITGYGAKSENDLLQAWTCFSLAKKLDAQNLMKKNDF